MYTLSHQHSPTHSVRIYLTTTNSSPALTSVFGTSKNVTGAGTGVDAVLDCRALTATRRSQPLSQRAFRHGIGEAALRHPAVNARISRRYSAEEDVNPVCATASLGRVAGTGHAAVAGRRLSCYRIELVVAIAFALVGRQRARLSKINGSCLFVLLTRVFDAGVCVAERSTFSLAAAL